MPSAFELYDEPATVPAEAIGRVSLWKAVGDELDEEAMDVAVSVIVEGVPPSSVLDALWFCDKRLLLQESEDTPAQMPPPRTPPIMTATTAATRLEKIRPRPLVPFVGLFDSEVGGI